ncbi:MAG: hypothetical protein K5829_10880 [Treponema sp.]|nr:hypothetical protein [Treponema sp.]
MQAKKISLFFFLTFAFVLYAKEPLPGGYKNILLGLSLDDTKHELIKNTDFGYHGDRDVSLRPNDNQVIIETDATNGYGSIFLTQCWFQFYEKTLYSITINMNTDKLDYYSVFTTLTNKYGQPDYFSPTQAKWSDDSVTMILEKPLALKYIDNKIQKELQNYSNIQKSATELTKEMFLGEL